MKKGRKWKIQVKPSKSGKNPEEIIQELVDQTVKKAVAKETDPYYNIS